jgi:hypothetical protein
MTVNSKIKELNFCSNLRIFLLQLFSKVNIINKNLHMPGIQGSEAYSYKKHTSPLFLMTNLTDHDNQLVRLVSCCFNECWAVLDIYEEL